MLLNQTNYKRSFKAFLGILFTGSILDAILTIFSFSKELIYELNPLMLVLLSTSSVLFFLFKLVLTICITLVLLYCFDRQQRLTNNLTFFAALIYTIVNVYHISMLGSIYV